MSWRSLAYLLQRSYFIVSIQIFYTLFLISMVCFWVSLSMLKICLILALYHAYKMVKVMQSAFTVMT